MACDADAMFICGDMNGRVGSAQDSIVHVDDIPERKFIDGGKYQLDRSLIEFLKESSFCVVNGRIEGNDGFTFVSARGTSVVDYVLVLHENYKECITFDVTPCSELVEQHSLLHLLSQKSKHSDHSVLTLKFGIKCFCMSLPDRAPGESIATVKSNYRSKKVDCNFMQSELANVASLRVIENIECNRERQQEMDKQILLPETQNGKRKLKQMEPFWNEDLSNLWKKMCSDEKVMTSCTNRRVTKVLRENYIKSGKRFDRGFRRAEHSYKRGK